MDKIKTLNYIVAKYKLKIKQGQDSIKIPSIDRVDLASLFAELEFKKGAEIGVEQGIYSEILLKANPKLHLYSIDPWKVYGKYKDSKNQPALDINYRLTQKRLVPYNCEIIRKSSTGALMDFAPRILDFVYIDGNHAFDYVWEDLNGWSKVVKVEGVVSGHDYRSRHKENYGVTEAVNKYIKEHNLKLFRTIKGGDSSWFFVNN